MKLSGNLLGTLVGAVVGKNPTAALTKLLGDNAPQVFEKAVDYVSAPMIEESCVNLLNKRMNAAARLQLADDLEEIVGYLRRGEVRKAAVVLARIFGGIKFFGKN